tara:strand:+ start:164 stop:1705 length:1542 start_codon:yes stop_codon:yes gene_type:complete
MSLHDLEARIASEAILQKWRSSDSHWENNFVSKEISFTGSSQIFPSPDNSFYDPINRTRLAMEFKPAMRETKRGLLTGLGQSIAYLSTSNPSGKFINDASILVVPDEIDSFQIGDFLEKLFNKFILDKLPIALVTFSPDNPANVNLRCNISSKLKPEFLKIFEEELSKGRNKKEAEEIARISSTSKEKEGKTTYWAYWREYYPDNAYRYLKTAAENPDKKPQEIFKIYYKKYYCFPTKAKSSLELLSNGMKSWDKDQIWLESTKKKLNKLISERKIKKIDALNRIRFEAATNQKERSSFFAKIKNTDAGKKSKTDSNYTGIRKNLDNSNSHLGLWDANTFNLTNDGKSFLKRIEEDNDQIQEQAMLFICKGRWIELIKDIENFQKECPKKYLKDKKNFLKEAKNYFYDKGFISLNSKREKTASRKFLQSEITLLKRFGILKTFKNGKDFQENQGFNFDYDKINSYQNKFMQHYSDKDSLHESTASDLMDELLDKISELSEEKLLVLNSYIRNL